jgi:hypothetical protein
MAKTGRTHVNQSVSFPPELLKEAKDRAKRLRLNFSAYIQRVIEGDLKVRDALVIDENAAPHPDSTRRKH